LKRLPQSIERLESRLLMADISGLRHFGPDVGTLAGTGGVQSPTGPEVTTWVLLDGVSGQPVATFAHGARINLREIPNRSFNIEAIVTGGTATGVAFGFDGNRNFRTDVEGEFTLRTAGAPLTAAVGTHAVVATPQAAAGGAPGRAAAATFSFVDAPAGPADTLVLSADTLEFGDVVVGQTLTRQVTLTNAGAAGQANVTVTSVTAGTGDFADDFGPDVTLAPGESRVVTVSFKPSRTGSRTGTLRVQHDGANTPLTVDLIGRGRNAPNPSDTLPAVTSTDPASGAAGVRRDKTIQVNLKLPNGPLNASTVNDANVQLVRVADQARVPAALRVAGDNSIRIDPDVTLDANTAYEIRVSAGVKDNTGAALAPANIGFTTGDTFVPAASVRTVTDLDPDWKFFKGDVGGAQNAGFNDAGWSAVDLPHTYNATDGQDGGGDFYTGVGWYRKSFDVPASFNGRETFIRFDGAFLMADVYVNGQFAGRHEGGFSAFAFDVTPLLVPGQANLVAVKVDNTPNAGVAPLSGSEILLGGADFTFFGGLYRGVDLISTSTAHVDLLDFASGGLYVKQQNVTDGVAQLQVVTKLRNDAALPRMLSVTTDILDAGGTRVATVTASQLVPGNTTVDVTQPVTINNPHLWNGVSDPHLYEVYVTVAENGTVVDTASDTTGLRYFRVDPDQGFFLNGRHLDLHGVNYHQDRINEGWAVEPVDQEQDVALMKEMGVNFVRMSHYQHHPETYDLLDQAGIITWSEIPYIYDSTDTPAFKANIEQQLREMIRQNFNSPSIAFWGLFNGLELDPVTEQLVPHLNDVAHQEDPSRLTTGATVTRNAQNSPINFFTDVIAYNNYFGWYRGNFEDFGAYADSFHSQFPDQPFGISEFGAGGSVRQHGENVTSIEPTDGTFHPEEYQSLFHEAQWKQMVGRDYLWAKTIFAMFDFAVDERTEGDTPGRNDKGLVTYDRETRKDAFYFYKSNWTDTPTLHLNSKRYSNRPTRTVDVKAYSNLDAVQLFVNGQLVGSRNGNEVNVYTWEDVQLAAGENMIEVVGTRNGVEYSDSAVWNAPASAPPTNGLTGVYFNNNRLIGSDLIRYDSNLSFDWGSGAPAGIQADGWSARFTGAILADKSEEYTFYALADDGVRVFVNGSLVIDDWNNGASGERSGKITLEAGKRYTITVEYFDNVGNASLNVSWSSAGTPKQTIPGANLFTSF
jgi:beta-galactosidase